MTEERLPSKFAFILHADIAGSTALVQQDEELAHKRIQATFRRFGEIITKYHGHVCELRGDALLAELERASDAVAAALAFQVEQSEYLAQLNDNILPTVRVGIAMGEVIIADDTVTGAGVVLAQRVEQLSKAGGVCITGAIHEALPQRMPFAQESLGEQEVKGFDEPVHVYTVRLNEGAELPEPIVVSGTKKASIAKWVMVASVVILICGGGLLAWVQPWVPEFEPASAEAMAFPLPDKPSIAVLPFNNMSDDARQEYFTDGMTEDVITDLSKISGLFVIARNSSFSYKGQQVKVRQVAEELGVRYVLEGSVRRAGNEVRINAQLIDATTGGHLWAERYDGTLEDIFDLQDKVTAHIVAALTVSLTGEEQAQKTRRDTNNVEAHDAYLQGWARYKLLTPKDLAEAVPFFEEALRLDPSYAQAHAALASLYWDVLQNEWAFDLNMPSLRAEEFANAHLEEALKQPTPLAHVLQARMLASWGFYDDAILEVQQAVALDKNDATALAGLANALIQANRPAEGLDYIEQAMRLDPHHPPSYLITLGAARFGMKLYQDAAGIFERAAKLNPDSEAPLIYLASSYGHLGRMDDADDAIETANDLLDLMGLGELSIRSSETFSLESSVVSELKLARFGSIAVQDNLRAGLTDIPALKWQYLVTAHSVPGPGNDWFEVEGVTQIDIASAKSLHDRGVVFIDSSEDRVWNASHIPGAVHLPFWRTGDPSQKRFRRTTLQEVAGYDDEVVFYFAYVAESETASASWEAAKANTWGYRKVYHFEGGARAWKDAGYPVETGP